MMLYTNSNAIVKFGNSVDITIAVEQGIKQGCPLSGTLWALLFRPLGEVLGGQNHLQALKADSVC